MLIYYNTGGWVANIALILNLLFTVGIFTALGATLTAPGIAGLVLTIGMAVDTNVIIFERIKEELTKGKDIYRQLMTVTAFVTTCTGCARYQVADGYYSFLVWIWTCTWLCDHTNSWYPVLIVLRYLG